MEPNEVGGNAAAVIRGYVNDLIDLKVQVKKVKGEIKDLKSDLKEEGLPPAALVKVARQDEEKAAEVAEGLKLAGAFLGRVVYGGAVEPDRGRVQEMCERSDGLQEFVDGKVAAILEAMEQIEELNTKSKDVLAKAKAEGFIPKVLEYIVELKLDPKKAKKQGDFSVLVGAYMKAVGL